MNPAALLPGSGEHVAQRGPRAERAVAGHELRLVQPAVAQIAEHGRPRVLALAVAVLDREQLLLAVLADADHHQQAQLRILAEADADVHAVDEQVGVAVKPQLPGAERGVLGLPLLGQPLDRARRQPRGVLAQQIPERRPEVAGREPVQVQDRQHLGHLRRPPAYAGRIRELNRLRFPVSSSTRLSFTRGARTGTVPDPTVSLRSRARPLRTTSRLPSSSTSSTNDADVLVDLGLERRRDHPASALPREIIERDATLVVLPDGEPANI